MSQVRRLRRLAPVAALLAAGALVLAGCRSDPQVAAYVGDTRYSQDRVTAIADEAQDKLQQALGGQASTAGASGQPERRPVSDQEVVAALVGRDVLKALAEERKINPLAVDANQMAQQVGVPPDTEYVRALTERDGFRLGLLQQWKSAEPSEAELREVYDNLVKGTGGQYTDSFEQFTAGLPEQSVELVGRSAALRKEIEAEARKLDVTINPRYGPAAVSLVNTSSQQGGPLISLIEVQLSARESGVRDVS
jgi:hypothetical protein